MPETQHVIPYNCHGMTVYISNVEDWLLHWLFPVFMLLSLIAAGMALLTLVRVRVDVKVHVNDTAGGSPDSDTPHH